MHNYIPQDYLLIQYIYTYMFRHFSVIIRKFYFGLDELQKLLNLQLLKLQFQVIQCNLFGVTTVPTRYCTRRHKYILLAQRIVTDSTSQEQFTVERLGLTTHTEQQCVRFYGYNEILAVYKYFTTF